MGPNLQQLSYRTKVKFCFLFFFFNELEEGKKKKKGCEKKNMHVCHKYVHKTAPLSLGLQRTIAG